MRISLIIVALLPLLWSSPAAAQTLVMRSGEHDTFTRLVTRIPDGVSWRVEQNGVTAQFVVDAPDIRFDIANVFSIIPRDRLLDVWQDEPGAPLKFRLACPCPITTFSESGNYAVLDIGDPDGSVAQVDPDQELRSEKQEPALPPVLPFRSVTPFPNSSPNAIGHGNSNEGVSTSSEKASDTRIAAQSRTGTSMSERMLQQQVARAATQGLIDVHQDSLPEFDNTASSTLGETSEPISMNLRVETSVDRDMSLVPSDLRVNSSVGRCVDADQVDIRSWGDERPFGHQIGSYRTRLVGEFDDLQSEDMKGLAKTYLYFGFGAEARRLLSDTPDSEENHQVLLSLSELVEFGALTSPHPFENQKHCDSVLALWSVLADPISPKDVVNSGAVVRALVEMPEHLRSLLGPGLLRRFTDVGDTETAELLVRVINRSVPVGGAPMQMAEAELARLNGDVAEADSIVEEVALSGAKESPEALIKLSSRHFDAREALGKDTVDLLETYVLELRNSSLGSEVAANYSVALALAGDFRLAFEVMEGLDKANFEYSYLRNLTLLTERADDLTFFQLSLGKIRPTSDNLPPDLIFMISRRYIEIGFPEQAIELLELPSTVALPGDDVFLLRAEAALAAGLSRRALLELVGRNSVEAVKLRAQALQMSGLHADAAELFAAGDDIKEAARSAWLADLPPSQHSAYAERQAASQRLLESSVSQSEVSLAGARALLNQAETIRRDIDLLGNGMAEGSQ